MKIHICRYDARGALAASSVVGIVAINEMEFDEETTDGNPAVAITVEQIDGGTIVYTKITDEETPPVVTIVGRCERGHVLTATTETGVDRDAP